MTFNKQSGWINDFTQALAMQYKEKYAQGLLLIENQAHFCPTIG